MGDLAKLGWQRMDVLVSEHGAEDVLHMVCNRVSDGDSLKDVCAAEGIPYNVLWKWLSAENRMAEYELALKARADADAHDVVTISDMATPEDSGVAKLRMDGRKWRAGKWDKDRYGEASKVQMDVRYQVDLAGALLEAEARREVLHKPATVDNDTGEVV